MTKPFISIDSASDTQGGDEAAAPGTAKLRVNAGVLEASSNAGAWSPIVTDATAAGAIATGGVDVLAPSITFTTTPTALATVEATLAEAKTVLFTVQGTAYSTGTNTEFHFYLVVNEGDPSAVRRCFINPASQHMAFGGSWIVELPEGEVEVVVYGVRVEGSGTITLTADDFVCATFIG